MAGGFIPARISEINEVEITYKKTDSAPTYTLHLTQVQKIRFKNGLTEVFKQIEKKAITDSKLIKANALNKSELSLEEKAKIEKIVANCGLKIARCAFSNLQNCSSSVDWGVTRRDIFNEGIIIIIVKVNYNQIWNTDTESFIVSLSLNEKTKNISWRLLNSTNPAHGIEILKCQKH
ncbi:MAG: hypothetical protein HYX39_13240 [Bacteroidetes bacterium]|nr:hypothetical protein [Bacteroidota bacterium]